MDVLKVVMNKKKKTQNKSVSHIFIKSMDQSLLQIFQYQYTICTFSMYFIRVIFLMKDKMAPVPCKCSRKDKDFLNI